MSDAWRSWQIVTEVFPSAYLDILFGGERKLKGGFFAYQCIFWANSPVRVRTHSICCRMCVKFLIVRLGAELDSSHLVCAKMRDLGGKAHEAWSRGFGRAVGLCVATSANYDCYVLPCYAMDPWRNAAGRRRRMSPILVVVFLLIAFTTLSIGFQRWAASSGRKINQNFETTLRHQLARVHMDNQPVPGMRIDDPPVPESCARISAHVLQLQQKLLAETTIERVLLPEEQDSAPDAGDIKCGALLHLATTFIEFTEDARKIAAQDNVLRSYKRLRQAGGVQAFLFTKNAMWSTKARAHNVVVVSDIEWNVHGTPLVKHMFDTVHALTVKACGVPKGIVFDGYVNGDIVFTQGLINTLQTLRHGWKKSIADGSKKVCQCV